MAEAKTAAKAATEFPSLIAALADFQKVIPVPKKESSADTGKYSYDYAGLDALTPLILPLLAERGITYTTVPHLNSRGDFVLKARLSHTSGESIGGNYPLGNPNAPAQAIGSAVTYARRYALLSLTGVAPTGEDDDGAKGAEAAGSTKAKAEKAEAAAPKESIDTIRAEIGKLLGDDSNELTGEDANAILAQVSGTEDATKWLLVHYKKGLAELKKLAA